VVSHRVFFNLTNARVNHERWARLHKIGPVSLRQALLTIRATFSLPAGVSVGTGSSYLTIQLPILKNSNIQLLECTQNILEQNGNFSCIKINIFSCLCIDFATNSVRLRNNILSLALKWKASHRISIDR